VFRPALQQEAKLALEWLFPDLMLERMRGMAKRYCPAIARLGAKPGIGVAPNVGRLDRAFASVVAQRMTQAPLRSEPGQMLARAKLCRRSDA
jgi:hypothetical protein